MSDSCLGLRPHQLSPQRNLELIILSLISVAYSCFGKRCPTKPYATMLKGIMGNRSLWYLIEVLGVSATQRESSQTNLFMPSLFLLVNTVNLNQSTPNSFYP